jgi:hypothetical protein
MRRAAIALGVFGVLLGVSSVVLFVIAIWAHGDDAGRWGGTGVAAFFSGAICVAVGFTAADELKS